METEKVQDEEFNVLFGAKLHNPIQYPAQMTFCL